ncbi:glycoside hydrolase family 16 protein [Pseudohyphozyma bogoriensis]|nr:glycoside hydrolase family 16 protein [Pseudohyphozyma bogoriensis]
MSRPPSRSPTAFSLSPLNPNAATLSERSSSDSLAIESNSAEGRRRSSILDQASFGVLSGAIGGSLGPYPRTRSSTCSTFPSSPPPRQSSLAGSDFPRPESRSRSDSQDGLLSNGSPVLSDYASFPSSLSTAGGRAYVDEDLLWDEKNAEADDYLHNPDPAVDRLLDKEWVVSFQRGADSAVLVIVVIVLIGLFAGWPIWRFAIMGGFPAPAKDLGWNVGGINGSGQQPMMPFSLIDTDTPSDVYQKIGLDGEEYSLVFSDEFNTDGRTFWPGDDPWWEALDLNYWQTKDLEWYDPDAIITRNGNLEITLTEQPINNLSFRSGMLSSWNKFCFTGGIMEVRVSLPGTSEAQGYWPGVWTLGNLGRPGYGATNQGIWPYSYGECDVGTLPNQTWPNGTDPVAAKTSGDPGYGGELSWLPGQIAADGVTGSASQSIQIAPFDAGYNYSEAGITIVDRNRSIENIWRGSVNQESLSVATLIDQTSYEGRGYTTVGVEYEPGPDGSIAWTMNSSLTWKVTADAMPPNEESQVGQRLISEEPMAMVIDYVRVWQKGEPNIGCDPASHPTADYIDRHPRAYQDSRVVLWGQGGGDSANYSIPKNSLSPGGCGA